MHLEHYFAFAKPFAFHKPMAEHVFLFALFYLFLFSKWMPFLKKIQKRHETKDTLGAQTLA